MCGIAGVVNVGGVSERDVASMIQCIRYRGPDEAGVKSLGRAIIGHARLAVVDPENGHQPMCNTDETVWVTFNGEIYNYVELREELRLKGYRFKSRCDTEVLVHLWREEGEKMLERLIGMFAFFIWDTRENRGILVRDRQGIKPCYFAEIGNGIAFASELKSILSLPDFETRPNNDALMQVFAFNYCPPPETCFEGIRHLSPGTYLRFEGDRPPTQHSYWQWPFYASRYTPSAEEFGELMDDAVRMQMRFDVKGGIYLSGGVDSTIVAGHLLKQWNEPTLSGVALDFEDPRFSELEYSKKVAEKYNIALSVVSMSCAQVPLLAANVVHHAEQPHGDFSFFLFYLLAEEAHRQHKIVMFSGDGPDETLVGFTHNERYLSRQGRLNFAVNSYFDTICYMRQRDREELLTPEFRAVVTDPLDRFESLIAPWRDLDPVEQIAAYESTALMPGNNLVKTDRMGARSSIEGRSPFLDHRIAELFARLPLQEKFRDGIGKYFLKQYALQSFDADFIFRPKTMPTAPIGEWLKGDLYGWARDLLQSEEDGRFQTKAVLRLLDEHRRGERNGTSQLRTILMTKIWLREFFAGKGAFGVAEPVASVRSVR